VSLLAIRERELDLYTNNCRNIGSQAALLAGFAYGALTYQVVDISGICTVFKAWEGTASHQECRLSLSYELTIGSYEVIAFLAMMLNVASAFGATVISMLGPGLALRGQDGAMDQAVEGLALEYRTVFLLFMGGVFSYYMCFCVFLAVDYDSVYGVEDALLHLMLLGSLIFFVRSTLSTTKRIYKKFRLPPDMAVAGSFDPDGKTMREISPDALELEQLSMNKKWYQWPRRQYLYVQVFMDEFLGISSKLFAERYKRSSLQQSAGRRPNNQVLHKIIRTFEVPGASLGRRSSCCGGGGAVNSGSTSSTRAPPQVTTSNARPAMSWLRRGGEEKRGLAGLDSAASRHGVTELELSAMAQLSPADHLNSGAISPADSDTR